MTTGTALALALPQPARTTLAVVLATAVWVGGLVAIFVVVRPAVVAAALVAWPSQEWAQARRMTWLRQRALRDPGHAELAAKVRQGARNAAVLRAAIAALSLALLALGTIIAP